MFNNEEYPNNIANIINNVYPWICPKCELIHPEIKIYTRKEMDEFILVDRSEIIE